MSRSTTGRPIRTDTLPSAPSPSPLSINAMSFTSRRRSTSVRPIPSDILPPILSPSLSSSQNSVQTTSPLVTQMSTDLLSPAPPPTAPYEPKTTSVIVERKGGERKRRKFKMPKARLGNATAQEEKKLCAPDRCPECAKEVHQQQAKGNNQTAEERTMRKLLKDIFARRLRIVRVG